MCLLHYALRRYGFTELRRRRKAPLIFALLLILLVLALASIFRGATEVINDAASLVPLRGTILRFPSVHAARVDEVSTTSEATPPKPSAVSYIQDIVLLPDDILLLIRLPEYDGVDPGRPSLLAPKDQLTCLFDNISTSLTGLDYARGRALVRCRPPEINGTANNNVVGRVSGDGTHDPHSPEARLHVFNVCLMLSASMRVVATSAPMKEASAHVIKTWDHLVFEMWATETDVVLFAKGINKRQGHNVSPDELVCVFGEDDVDGVQVVETKLSVSAQEVFRCAHPPGAHRRRLTGKAVTLRWGARVLLPTVAYYEEFSTTNMVGADAAGASAEARHIPATLQNSPAASTPATKEICACTMVFNVAKFLPEWGSYHSHVGVDRFILYDNNSEDELEKALTWLTNRHLQISRYPWPWPKTQEAGFSHCVLTTSQTCQWVLFADVDEFVFPAAYLPPSGKRTPLRQLIVDAKRRPRQSTEKARLLPRQHTVDNITTHLMDSALPRHVPGRESLGVPQGSQADQGRPTVGQISLNCRDFGPSNLTQHPTRGVTQGYVCRSKTVVRHKSLVRLAAVGHDLQNVVHHFNLLPECTTVTEHPSRAVVNHYKNQAWPEFRQKFRRRVSAYVVDWKDKRNMGSQDRTPGLGARDLKPSDWETAFCEASDTALRDYCNDIFAINGSHVTPSTLAWQL